MPAIELKVPPLALTGVAMLFIVVASLAWPAASVPFPGHQIASISAAVAGLLLTVGSAAQFRLRRTTLDPRTPAKAKHFVASGFYRISRNPMYLGMACMLLAAALWHSSLPSYALTAAFCLYLTEFQIKPEERFLEQAFGSEYTEFKSKVRRWI